MSPPPPRREAFYLGGLFRGFPFPCPASFMEFLLKAPASRVLSLSLSRSQKQTRCAVHDRDRGRHHNPFHGAAAGAAVSKEPLET